MNTLTHNPRRTPARVLGFSLIEVLIAVLILATGLLALAALQSALNRNAADSRARSQVAAFVELAVERARTNAAGANYNKLPPAATWSNPWTAAEEDAVEARAGVSNLNVTITGTQWDGRTGTFVAYDPATTTNPLKLNEPQYKELRAVATWNDATGDSRRYDLTTIVSPRTITDSNTPFDAATGPSADAKLPVVRTDSPERAGVIPIAIGDGSDTAATNPRPTINSGAVIRTSYEVLTYRNEDTTTVRQQRRVETAIVGCKCVKGAAPTGVFYEKAQWPAYWNGERYTLYSPTPAADAPGEPTNVGPVANANQDGLCNQCCRDHHDGNTAGAVKFDPFRSDGHRHFKEVTTNGVTTLELAGADDPYIEACRMIRVDGFWRTAQDLRSNHFGLLKTVSEGRSSLPETNPDTPVNSATEYYERFVIDYLKANYVPGQTAQTADALYEAKGLNAPALIRINRPTPTDTRYLHSRGLYVDNIEAETQDRINQAQARCTRPNVEDCVLPLLPFTSINVTEAAFYSTDMPTELTVASTGFVVYDTNNPNRGRVNAIATASPSSQPKIITQMQKSNSGLAVRPLGVDEDDNEDVSDRQTFEVAGAVANPSSAQFNVILAGLPAAQRAPGVAWMVGSEFGNCLGEGTYNCITTRPPGATNVTVIVSGFNQQVGVKEAATVTCPFNSAGEASPVNLTYTPKGQETTQFCVNYQVNAVSSPGALPLTNNENDGKIGNANNGFGSETSSEDFPGLVLVQSGTPNSVTFTFTTQGTKTVAPVKQCTYNKNGTLNTVEFNPCP